MTNKLTKNILSVLSLFCSIFIFSQTETTEKRVEDLKILEISKGVSLHIVSPEPIQFVDLSTNNLTGDLPAENIARIKITENSVSDSTKIGTKINMNDLGVITVVCQSFMAQYKVSYLNYKKEAVTNIQIQPEDMQPLEYPKMSFSNTELQKFSLDILRKKEVKNPIREVKSLSIVTTLKHF